MSWRGRCLFLCGSPLPSMSAFLPPHPDHLGRGLAFYVRPNARQQNTNLKADPSARKHPARAIDVIGAALDKLSVTGLHSHDSSMVVYVQVCCRVSPRHHAFAPVVS
jgi:hypothetical protein